MLCAATTIDITADIGCRLAGGPFGPSHGVDQALTATVIVLKHDDKTAVIISCDLLGLDNDLATSLRHGISELVGGVPEAVTLTCTHTHNGPSTMALQGWGELDAGYIAKLQDSLHQATTTALQQLRPVELMRASVPAITIGTNRTRYGTMVDGSLSVLAFRSSEGDHVALIVNVACHPVYFHSTGLISADYPAYMRQHICQAYSAIIPIAFTLGACGDINPSDFTFELESQIDDADRAARRAAADRCGAHLADVCLWALNHATVEQDCDLSYQEHRVDFSLHPFPDQASCAKAIRQHRKALDNLPNDETALWQAQEHENALAWYEQARTEPSTSHVTVTMQALAIGHALVVATPFELFTEYGLRLKAAFPNQTVLVATLSNGYAGYLPISKTWELGTYEAIGVSHLLRRQVLSPQAATEFDNAAQAIVYTLNETHRNLPNSPHTTPLHANCHATKT